MSKRHNNHKAVKKFEDMVREHGLTLQHGKGHYAVLHRGKRVGTMSTTGDSNTCRAMIYTLARLGLVPQELKRERFS